ncbi:hypothetical protein HK405_010378 [Cladochytrium tenue]|nr:hypothetical protein HK405_010378 [Cladochytrium tenue]
MVLSNADERSSAASGTAAASSVAGSNGKGATGALRLPLLAAVLAVAFATTTLVGGITAYMSISASQATALDIASAMDVTLLESARTTFNAVFDSVVNITIEIANDPAMISLVATGEPYSWLSRMDILTKIYRRQNTFNFVGYSGMYFFPGADGHQALVALVPSTGQIQYQDRSVNGSLWVAFINGVDNNGQLAPVDPSAEFLVIPGGITTKPYDMQPYWLAPTAAPSIQTYAINYGLPVWAGLAPKQSSPDRPYDAVHVTGLTASSLDAFLRQIATTPNAILALVDCHTGVVVASSAPNTSVVWPTQFPAVGNPNGMLSAASAQLLSLYSTGPANDTTSFGLIADRTSQRFRFSFGGDTVYCSTSWIIDDPTTLSMVLILMVPTGDLLGSLVVTTRNSIIYVVLFTTFSFVLAGILAWAMVAPLRRVTLAIKQATNFDFQSLQSGLTVRPSWMAEIVELEEAFSAMLVRFADAVDQNKLLIAQTPSGSKRPSRAPIPQTMVDI